jgi:glucuronide carrier protein
MRAVVVERPNLVHLRKFDLPEKRAYVLAWVVAACAAVGFALAPASVFALGIAWYGVIGIGSGPIKTLIFALQADTAEYGERRNGVRAEGSSYAVLSFTRKPGQGIGGAAAEYTIGIGGHVSGAASQTDGAVSAIKVAAGIVPTVAVGAAVAVMLAYPLPEKAFRTNVAELAELRVGSPITATPIAEAT